MEYKAPPGSSRTSGLTALPPATLVGQKYTMYIDFPLDGNTLNPAVQALEALEALDARCGGPGCPQGPGGPGTPLKALE